MSRLSSVVFLAITLSPRLFAAEQGQLDGSLTLFTVLAAINVAGYDPDLDSPSNHPLRAAVRKHIEDLNLPVVSDLKKFYAAHKQEAAAQDLSQYVSFALSVKGAPDFSFRFRQLEVPPDVIALEALPPLMTRFFREARIEEIWAKSQPAFDEVIARYHVPTSRALLEVNSYLRNPTSGFTGRRFQVYVDLLGAPNQIQTRSYAGDSFVVLTPSPEPQVNDIRHAYLHYLLDPAVARYGIELEKKKPLADFAQPAPALPEAYKTDFMLLTVECLVKAVESRLARGAKRQELVDQALREGYILTPYFAEQMPVYEKQETALRHYVKDLIEKIDLAREDERLTKVEFAEAAQVRKARHVAPPPPPELKGADKTLAEAEGLYASKEWDKAKEAYLKALRETDDLPLHAKCYYGLARIAVIGKDPETGERLFQKALECQPDDYTRGWVLVYLGRLADAAGERDQAVQYYKNALSVRSASRAARLAAEKGIQESFRK